MALTGYAMTNGTFDICTWQKLTKLAKGKGSLSPSLTPAWLPTPTCETTFCPESTFLQTAPETADRTKTAMAPQWPDS